MASGTASRGSWHGWECAWSCVACNNKRRGKEVINAILAEMGSDQAAHFLLMDLASLASIRSFACDFQALGLPLHLLVNNAGMMLEPWAETEDGFERHLGVNFLGHFLLTLLFLPTLHASGPGGGAHASSL